MLTLLVKAFNALNSENSPKQIAYAITLGMIMGLTPLFSLHNLIFLLLACVIRIHLGSVILSFVVFSGLSYLTDGVFSNIGHQLLTAASLESFWTTLYQANLFKFAHLHNTLTLGSLICASLFAIPLAMVCQWLIVKYRVHVMAFINKFKIVQALKGSKFYQAYEKVAGGA